MDSKQLNKIFGSKSTIQRKDIEMYGTSNDDLIKNEIEQKSLTDSFEGDALEGWSELSYDTSILAKSDNHFMKSSKSTWIWTVTICLILSVLLFYIPFKDENKVATLDENLRKEKVTTLMEDQELTIDESDLISSNPIQELKKAPVENQIMPQTIKNDFAQMTILKDEKKIDVLPPLKIEIEKDNKKEIIQLKKQAKEIYLEELKLVDYRQYRTKPTIKTKQIILSGTPANLERNHEEEFDSRTKTVDIPYLDYMNKSLRIFNKGNYKNALTRFQNVLGTYPDDVNAQFYSGLCLFNFGEYTSAIHEFNNCINGPYSNFDEESQWMIAISHLLIGEKSKAMKAFHTISEQGGYYSSQAKNKMKGL